METHSGAAGARAIDGIQCNGSLSLSLFRGALRAGAGPLLLAAVYFGAAKFGLSLAFGVEQVTAVWPPTGVALAATLLFGYRVWPGIALGAFLANATANEPVPTACGIATGNTLEALAGAWLLQRWVGFDSSLERLKDVVGLITLAAAVSTVVSATLGVMSLCLGGVQPWSAFGSLWSLWWLGDAAGNFVVAPVLLTWIGRPRGPWPARRLAEATALLAGLVALSLLVFSGRLTTGVANQQVVYTIFPFVVWAALRFGQWGTTAVTLLASGLAIWGTVHGFGPFVTGTANENLMLLQIFMAVVAATGLLLGAAVSERRLAAEALGRAEERSRGQRKHVAETQARLAAIVESSDDAIIGKTLDGIITSWNRGAEKVFGYAAAEVVGRPISLLAPPDRGDEMPHILERIRRRESIDRYETVRRHKDGRDIIVSLTVSPIRDDIGRIIGISKIARDVTEQRRAEQALRESETRFHQLADAMPQIVFVFRADGTLEFVNQQWTAYTGLTLEQAHNKDELRRVLHPDDFQMASAQWTDPVGAASFYQVEYRLKPASSEDGYRWFLVRGLPFKDDQGRVVRWLNTATDIDDHRRAEAALREVDRRKDQFLAMLAHELRNPLAGIRNSLHLIQMRGTSDPLVCQAQDIALRQIQLLARLVDDLVEVARVTSDKIELRKEPVDLARIVAHAVEPVRPYLEARGHKLNVHLGPEPMRLLADPARVGQILTNLLNNAAKYTPPGGEIELSVERAGDEVVLRVKDNGIGISPELLPKVFDLFVQADTSLDRSEGGLGIGLTLVKKLAEQHEGSVTAWSPGLGGGSEFTVRLPALPAAPSQSQEIGRAAFGGEGNGHRLLVLDDNLDGAESLALMLRLWGYAVRVVHDGQAALAMAQEWRPEAVLCDIGLPDMDGYEVARRLRRQPGLEAALLVAVSGYGEPEDRERARAAGFSAHLVKPVPPDTLLQTLAELGHHV